jgi:proton glutamate symport protein
VKLYAAVAIGLIGGLLLGLIAALTQSPLLLGVAEGIEPIGTAFVNLLKMVVIPLVAAVIFVGVATLGDLKRLGQIGALTLLFFAGTSAVAVLVGMGVMHLMLPLANEAAAQAVATAAPETRAIPGPIDFIISLIPDNPFKAAADGSLLPLIVFMVLFGSASGALPDEERGQLVSLGNAVTAALIKLVHWILWLAPLGVFALAAPVTARAGWAMLISLGAFVLAVLVGLVLFVSIIFLPMLRFVARMPANTFLKAVVNPLLIAASTSSTAATVPAMLEAADDGLGVSRSVSSVVIPLGAGVGRMGTALFQGAGIIFLAWLYGVPLPAASIGGAVMATFMVSFTVAGIPAGGVVSLAPAIDAVGVPIDGLGVLLGIDRIPDMARTTTNVAGILTAAVVLDRLLGGASAATSGS